MASFYDFTGNLFDDQNSDWKLVDDCSIRLSTVEGLDTHCYQEIVKNDGLNPQVVGSIKEQYIDEFWGQHASSLLGNCQLFTNLTTNPTQRFCRRQQNERYFFDLFWDDATIHDMVQKTNRYARQDVMEYQSQYQNGGPKWTDITAVEFRAWLGIMILMGLKVAPTIRDYWKKNVF